MVARDVRLKVQAVGRREELAVVAAVVGRARPGERRLRHVMLAVQRQLVA